MIKLSVNETKWSSSQARTRALIFYILIWIFDFGPENLPGRSRNGPQVCYYLHSSQLYVTLLKRVVVQFYPDFSNTTAGWFELKQGTPFPRQTMPEFYPRLFVSRFENSPLHYLRKCILINKCSFPGHIQNVCGSVQISLLQKLPQKKKTQLTYPVSLMFHSL